MAPLTPSSLTLYTAPLSGCAARVRIALLLKRISVPTTLIPVSTASAEQKSQLYVKQNPNGSIPTLIASYANQPEIRMIQSITMLDYLEHTFPKTKCLIPGPDEPLKRASVMDLVNLVSNDIQPPQTGRVRAKLKELYGADGEHWALWVYERGLGAYDEFLGRRDGQLRGKYSIGEDITWADLCLLPAVQGGLRVGLDLAKFGHVKDVVDECWKLDEFRKGGLGSGQTLKP